VGEEVRIDGRVQKVPAMLFLIKNCLMWHPVRKTKQSAH